MPENPNKAEQLWAETLAEYNRRLAELQASCPHAEVSGWLEVFSKGFRWKMPYDIRVCLECDKEMGRREHSRVEVGG